MNYTRLSPAGIEVSDTDLFAIRLFILSESKGQCNLPVDSILKLVDIFDVINSKKESA